MKQKTVTSLLVSACLLTHSMGFAPNAHALGVNVPASEATAASLYLAMTYVVSIGTAIGLAGTAAGVGTAAIAISLGAGTAGAVAAGIAGGSASAVSGSVTLYAGAEHRNREALLLTLKEDAAVHIATEGKVTSELLSSTLETIREDLKQNPELKALKFTDDQLAEALIAAE